MATSFLLRKSLTIPGAITMTGNTLGLSDKNYPYRTYGPGFFGLSTLFTYYARDIGVFTTTDTAQQVSGYPAGTTNSWGRNSSSAILNLPAGAIVKYAELVWGGGTRSNGFTGISSENLDGVINTPVSFKVPGGTTYNISPDPASSGTTTIQSNPLVSGGLTFPYTGGTSVFYVRSQNVTDIVRNFGSGTYTCGGVPAAVNFIDPSAARCCGWDLIVLYELPSLKIKNLSLFIGIDGVGGAGVTAIQYTFGGTSANVTPSLIPGPREIIISGFVTPSNGPVRARLLLSAMGGAPQWQITYGSFTNIGGTNDIVKFGPNNTTLTTLSGPNNLINNFFASQINNDNGLLDTTGYFGNLNANPSNAPIGSIARQGWDITNLGVSNILPNSTNTASTTIQTTGNTFALHLLALEVEVNAPTISVEKNVSKQTANLGDVLLYTVVVRNTGTTDATNVVFVDTIPNGTSFVTGSVAINGTTNPLAIPNPPGFSLPNIPQNGVVTVTFNVNIGAAIPSPNPIPNTAQVNFKYQQATGLPIESGSSLSNTVNTLVAVTPNPVLNTIKSVNKTQAVVGETIQYTVVLSNAGNNQLNNIVFVDTTPAGTTFVNGSLIVRNQTSALDPQNGVPIGTLAVGENVTLIWNVMIGSIPSPNPVTNIGFTGYNFVTGTNPNAIGGKLTNIVATTIQNIIPNLQVEKSVNKTIAAVGETISYTIDVTNKGNTTLSTLSFKDILQSSGVTFVPNSVSVNGSSYLGANPVTGFSLTNTLPVGESIKIQFQVLVNTIPSPNPIPNTGDITYFFAPRPGETPVSATVTSNEVLTNVFLGVNPVLSLNKTVNSTTAEVGDTLVYTIGIVNNGNRDFTDVYINDIVPNGTSYVPGTLELNFSPVAGTPNQGVTIPQLPQDGLAILSFNVIINQVPIPNPIPNSANGRYKYLNDLGTTITTTTISNTVTTLVKIPLASASLDKTTDKEIATVNEIITYTIRLTNTGGIDLNNVFFVDTLPNGVSFVSQSVTVDGISNTAADPQVAFNTGNLINGAARVIQFKVRVDTIPVPNPLLNRGNIIYKYTTNNNNPNANSGSQVTNTVQTQVIKVDNNLNKAVDLATASVGDTITYTLVVKNDNIIAINNIIIYDTIPASTTFVTNSVNINNNPTSFNPATGIKVGTLQPSQLSTVTFKVTINTIPNPNEIKNLYYVAYDYNASPTSITKIGEGISNEVITTVSLPVSVIKRVNKNYSSIGEELTYTITIKNTGNATLSSIIFTDTIQATSVSFVPGSLNINSVANPGNPALGVNIGNILSGATTTLLYKVVVNSIPNPNPIPNIAEVNYTYTPSGSGPITTTTNSNLVNTQVNSAGINAIKSTNKNYADCKEVVTYTIDISNNGNVDAVGCVFRDTVPNGTTFVPNSVTVNGLSQAGVLPTSIPLGVVPIGGVTSITFKVLINCQ